MKKTKVMVGSITYAIKLRKLLLREGINSSIVKGDKNGCVHGLEVDYSDFYTVISIMRENNIEYSVE